MLQSPQLVHAVICTPDKGSVRSRKDTLTVARLWTAEGSMLRMVSAVSCIRFTVSSGLSAWSGYELAPKAWKDRANPSASFVETSSRKAAGQAGRENTLQKNRSSFIINGNMPGTLYTHGADLASGCIASYDRIIENLFNHKKLMRSHWRSKKIHRASLKHPGNLWYSCKESKVSNKHHQTIMGNHWTS